MAEKKLNFEKSVARLDEIVKRLENGELPLDEAMKYFEEGTALIASCTKMLDEAEQKVVKLKKGPDREPVEMPFEDENV